MVYFMENYTLSHQKEIQSEYYHLDQVSIFVHILYIHIELDIDSSVSNENDHEVSIISTLVMIEHMMLRPDS